MTGNLEHFVIAQDPVFDRAISELRAGRKKTHWMWFIFPQLAGLGRSPTAQRFGLSSLGKAQIYLSHAVLGQRLKDATKAVMAHVGEGGTALRSTAEIFGWPDEMKFHSSMTLFHRAAPKEALFKAALSAYCNDLEDEKTIALLNAHAALKDEQS